MVSLHHDSWNIALFLKNSLTPEMLCKGLIEEEDDGGRKRKGMCCLLKESKMLLFRFRFKLVDRHLLAEFYDQLIMKKNATPI